MKLPASKGKFVVLAIYLVIVFLSPIYSAVSYDPQKASTAIAKLVPEKDDQFFRSYIGLLRDQKIDQAYALLSLGVQQGENRNNMIMLAKQLASTTDNMSIVAANITYVRGASSRTGYNISYEIPNSNAEKKYILAQIVANDQGQGIRIDGIQIYFGSKSLKENGKFSLPKPYWLLVLAILAPLFVAYTAHRYITKAAQPKWWLFLVILLGSLFITVRADGGFAINVGFYGFMGPSGIWGPWTYFTSLPIGAICYYLFWRQKAESVATPIVVQE